MTNANSKQEKRISAILKIIVDKLRQHRNYIYGHTVQNSNPPRFAQAAINIKQNKTKQNKTCVYCGRETNGVFGKCPRNEAPPS